MRRQLDSLMRRGMIGLRTDFARREVGGPTQFVLWLSVPPRTISQVGLEIGQWPETRICFSTAGMSNLLVVSQVHHAQDLYHILERLRTSFPEVMVTDRRMVLRPFKSWGRLLDADGHAVDVVPVDPWAPVSVATDHHQRPR